MNLEHAAGLYRSGLGEASCRKRVSIGSISPNLIKGG